MLIMITTKKLANKYNISTRTINNWVRSGQIDVIRNSITDRIIWNTHSVSNLKKFVEKNKIKSNSNIEVDKFNIENRRYLGSKARMLEFIYDVVKNNTKDVNEISDIFGGTGVVANYFYNRGYSIKLNDILDSNYMIYNAFFSNEKIDENKIKKLILKMNHLSLKENYVSKNYGNKYFSKKNAMKIGEAREFIENQKINIREKSILLTSLLYAMDKVANTVGHYDAYRKVMDSNSPILFRMPNINKNNKLNVELFHEDANELVKSIKSDLVYIDTPYNSRQYGDVYHVLENIIDWNKPKLYGVAMKPKDRSKKKSYYSTSKAPEVFNDLITNINSKYIIVSYNNMAKKGNGRSNAKISNKEIIEILSSRGEVKRFELPFQAFTAGKTDIKNHKEFLYLVEVVK